MPNVTDPYELALGVLAGTPVSLAASLEPLPMTLWKWSPAPGEWTPYETLAHMLRVETAIIPVRVRQMLAEDGATLASPPEATASEPPEAILRAWQDAREANLIFLRALLPAQLDRSGIHPRLGRITAREHIIEWAYHDLDHQRQLQATVEAYLHPSIGAFRSMYTSPYPTDS